MFQVFLIPLLQDICGDFFKLGGREGGYYFGYCVIKKRDKNNKIFDLVKKTNELESGSIINNLEQHKGLG